MISAGGGTGTRVWDLGRGAGLGWVLVASHGVGAIAAKLFLAMRRAAKVFWSSDRTTTSGGTLLNDGQFYFSNKLFIRKIAWNYL